MKTLNQTLLTGLVGLAIIAGTSSAMARGGKAFSKNNQATTKTMTLDKNEQAHLMFMREEEKLARDVYLKLGEMYPDSRIFGKIDDSEQKHTMAVKDMIEKYGFEDPNTNDNVGAYTGKDYGEYFTEKYNLLVKRASISELEALYVGAFIEELDMQDINQCPKVIVEADNGINDVSECGKIYTDNADAQKLYGFLLDGSDSHLAGYVKNIEKYTGKGSYQAQVLPQAEVDKMLGR
ncbi:DUF2202 domain-containing protein [uncultured Cocleimonas sp.]|uniref:DUF2202 domain-containing protein n=1 Tax=uncultured Cocleimonas sp. TaxID=1051587 RepID=UPI002630BD1D|nr:DUF2202 domain-containing protein [uncultured Cocleimonas sp.]